MVVVNGHEFQLVHKDVSVVDQVLSFCDEKSLDSNLCSLTKKAVFGEYASILNDDRVNLKPLPCFDSGLLGVHSIGDSHSQWTNDIFGSVSGEIEFFNHHLGPKLMYSFGRPNVYMNPHATHCIRPSDIVAFSFGEIDARCHLHKYYSGGQNIVSGIDEGNLHQSSSRYEGIRATQTVVSYTLHPRAAHSAPA